MSALQLVTLIVVALTGTAVIFTGDLLRQVIVLGIYGLALTVLFFVFEAPDVALSEIVVSAVGLPLIVLAALRKISSQQEGADRVQTGEAEGRGSGRSLQASEAEEEDV